MSLLGKMRKEWQSVAVIFALFACYYVIRSLPSAGHKPRAPISPENAVKHPAKPEKKWVYAPEKVYPPKWYAIPTSRNEGTCTRKNNLYFLRTHQTGTSSVTNIFYRYGQEHDLSFVMYPLKLSINYPGRMGMTYLEAHRPKTGYNILCQYIRHEKMDVLRIMPDGVIFTSLLRHPLDQFLSVFNNFDMKSTIPNLQPYHNPYREFFRNPDRIAKLSSDTIYHMLQNSMSFDMGLKPIQFGDADAVEKFIERVDGEFHLVMILEFLDESLVLLKRLMCWDLRQLIYVKLSVNNEYRTSVDPDIQERILEWNAIDLRLYNHFKAKLERLIEAQDASFHEEVAALKALNVNFWKECYSSGNALPVFNGNKIGYILAEDHKDNSTCKLLATDDVTQTHLIGMKQFKEHLPPSDILMVRNHMQNLKKYNPAMLGWSEVKNVLKSTTSESGNTDEL